MRRITRTGLISAILVLVISKSGEVQPYAVTPNLTHQTPAPIIVLNEEEAAIISETRKEARQTKVALNRLIKAMERLHRNIVREEKNKATMPVSEKAR